MSAILAFNESGNLPFRKVTPEFLKSFEAYLRGRNCSWNTVSTYMRTLRAVYNRAVDRRIAPYVPHHFRYVYTGTRADKKRALEKEDMERLMKDIPKQLHLSSEENRQNADCDSFAGSGEIDQTAYEYRSCFSLSLFVDFQQGRNGGGI